MNAAEQILAAHSNTKTISPGMIIEVTPDAVMANDATACLAIDIFRDQLKAESVFDPGKIILVMDHYTPSSSIAAADTHRKMRRFAAQQKLSYVYDGKGICHQLMVEHHVSPGKLIIGADSHTCTYGALGALATGMGSTDIAVLWKEGKTWMKVPETVRITVSGRWPAGVFAKDLMLKIIGDLGTGGATYQTLYFDGEAICALSISERLTLTNMVIEAGAKFAYIAPDEVTRRFLKQSGRPAEYVSEEDGIPCKKQLRYDVSELQPQIAVPHSVDNVSDITAYEGLEIDECFLGGCTNGRYEDLEVAAKFLAGRTIAGNVRMLVTPASSAIYLRAMATGVLATLMKSGAMISAPGCSACFGGTGGILGQGERLLSTANRNFKGRAGSPDSEIYLASPAVVAASAVKGYITDPRRKDQ